MRQKLVLGCALVHEPDLLLLDEPTTGIDPLSRREFWGILNEYLAQGRTIVYSSVYLEEAMRANRIALMSAGRVRACDTPERLLAAARGRKREVRVESRESGNADRTAEVLGSSGAVASVRRVGARIEVLLADAPDAPDRVERELAAAGAGGELAAAQPTLEDVFVLLEGGRMQNAGFRMQGAECSERKATGG
jgi:ABC-2 type transport system ATP-binding protein